MAKEDKSKERELPPARTSSGLDVKVAYGPDDLAQMDFQKDLGEPGEYPFTRGIQPTMYRGRVWTMREYAGLGTAEESNARYKYLLSQGQTGLSVAFDLPTQLGYDSDDPQVAEEVARLGVAIDTLTDMETLFDGIPLDRISTSFTINATAAIVLAMYLAVAEKQGVPWEKVTGTLQNDILKEYAARGAWIFPPEPALRLIADTIEFCAEKAPRFNPISIAGAHFRDAGATAVQELAYTLADAIAYVEQVLARGMDIDVFAPQLSFFFYTHNDLFEEVAKYRAGRRLWARIMKDRFGAKSPRSQMFRCAVVCGGSTLTARQPLNNVVRVSYQALASVLGGVQSIFTCAYDEGYAIPTEESQTLALRTQQVLAYETGVTNTVDPLGGSYFVEALTDRMEQEVSRHMERIQALGGMVECIEKGIIQREILEEACRQQKQIESGEKAVIGVNRYVASEGGPAMKLYRMSPEVQEKQLARLAATKASRSGPAVTSTLAGLRSASLGKENLMPFLLAAVKEYATVGEIVSVMREVFGEFREPVGL
ncbi:MAG: methylmalonyl-CoA mutase family protein [Dehalococcoidia bacterium]|nr:methylmalonyl-CoA mutase family protein [Dehalococcoidia bacterium]